uniref:Uncharacterized protein n=1 Tax=uncultured Methanosarcinales archaeon TaxID=183757 RepID=A0A7H1KNX4_9EURY|nr:hypothetical protein BFFPPMPJ_00043 [uncultured Methanosarcinales archaeon]
MCAVVDKRCSHFAGSISRLSNRMREQEETSSEKHDTRLHLPDHGSHAVGIDVHDLGIERMRHHAKSPDAGGRILYVADVPAIRNFERYDRVSRLCECKKSSDVRAHA